MYVYREREREGKRERDLSLSLYIYIYIRVYRERARQMHDICVIMLQYIILYGLCGPKRCLSCPLEAHRLETSKLLECILVHYSVVA